MPAPTTLRVRHVAGSDPPRFFVGVLVAALVILQTRVRFERTTAGKWKALIDKPTTSAKLLQPLVEKLLALLPPGGRG